MYDSSKILRILLTLLPLVIIVIIIVMLLRSSSNVNERYQYNPHDYKEMKDMPYEQNELTTCKRCHNFNASSTVYNGYQTAPEPPAPYWPSRNQPDILSTKSHFQNYARMSSPLDDTKFEQCHDAYRCNKYGVATGVQGRIF